MNYNINPRGDLPPATCPRSRLLRTPESARDDRRRNALGVNATHKARQRHQTCYDWIFSSASNVHIAIDYSSFQTYTPFESYVFSLSDQRQIPVLGIGTVALKIRRQPGRKDSHVVTLRNVLHVPSWMCNVFSDVYFEPATEFQHTWTDSGISFMQKKSGGTTKHWGFTEDFFGLERLVLTKDLHGRSPMLEEKRREVFSVNVTWPQGQRDRYEAYLRTEGGKGKQGEARAEGT